ncbi:hypothetical protein LTR51_001899 [Lithohypha guttulata]|nr:hypothetical protein LTR51_001899 [Lithohypha guttulata]
MTRPTATRNISSDSATVPGLTHQDSLESVRSPITPSMETSKNPIASPAHKSSFDEPLSAPPTITVFKTEHANTSEPVLPPKNLPFLQHDPYADDDVIQFDKNKEIKPSRSGSVRSIMSTSSVQSLKRGLSSLKRKLTTRGSRKGRPRPDRSQTAPEADGLRPPPRVGTLLTGAHTFKGPQRVETYQVASMAY